MRPVKPVKLQVSSGRLPENEEEGFWQAFSDFIEAFVRHQIVKARQVGGDLTDPTLPTAVSENGDSLLSRVLPD